MIVTGLVVVTLGGCAEPAQAPEQDTPSATAGVVPVVDCRGAPVPDPVVQAPTTPTLAASGVAVGGSAPAGAGDDPAAMARRRAALAQQADQGVDVVGAPPADVPAAKACAREVRQLLNLAAAGSSPVGTDLLRQSIERIGLRVVTVREGPDGLVFTGTAGSACVQGDSRRVRITRAPC